VNIPSTVLVLRFSAVGDIILTGPAMSALKRAWPQTRLVFGTKDSFRGLIEHHPAVDEVLALKIGESALHFAQRARALGVESVLNLHGTLRSRIVSAAINVPSVTWSKRPFRETAAVKFFRAKALASETLCARSHRAVEMLTGQTLARQPLEFFPSVAGVVSAKMKMEQLGVDFSRPLLGLVMGAGWATKRWLPERFGALAARLSSLWQVVSLGSPQEASLTIEAKKHFPQLIDTTSLSLDELGAAISLLQACVSNDSGPLHMARGLGVPTLALFGSTDPQMFSFVGHHVLFKSELACNPCSFYGKMSCPKGHFQCMKNISVDEAWRALGPLLDGKRRPLVMG
jgi:ADP-heptose:LPS heptosyltransferase